MRSTLFICTCVAASAYSHAGAPSTPDLVAVYAFNGDFTSQIPGAPDLQVVNPGADFFEVEQFTSRSTGTWSWPAQTGLSLDTNGLLTGSTWTVGITFRFDSTASYNKILDTQNRVLDFGWYNTPSFQFAYFPAPAPGAGSFGPGTEVTAIITCNGTSATGYLNGASPINTGDRPDAIISEEGLLHFFLDDLPFASEVAPGTVAAIFVWDGELDAADIAGLLPLPQLIEPCNASDTEIPYGITDLGDINKFISSFLDMDPIADINPDGLYDLADIVAFIDGFTGGCP